jgi:hypothetical protein
VCICSVFGILVQRGQNEKKGMRQNHLFDCEPLRVSSTAGLRNCESPNPAQARDVVKEYFIRLDFIPILVLDVIRAGRMVCCALKSNGISLHLSHHSRVTSSVPPT